MKYDKVILDASIQRFEFTIEATWKAAQLFLKLKEGIESNSPKSVIRSCFEANLLDEDQTNLALQMIDHRNLSAQTYDEELADLIYSHLKDYLKLIKVIYSKINIT